MVGALKHLIPPHQFWGKLQRVDRKDPNSPLTAWHPLIDHCADVAACVVVLLGWRPGRFAPTLMNQRLARLAQRNHLDLVTVLRLGVLAALHDIGKFNHGFQAKMQGDRTRWAGHVSEVVPLITEGGPGIQAPFLTALAWSDLASWFLDPETGEGFLSAVVSHHGRPAEGDLGGFRPTLWSSRPDRDPLHGIAELVAATRRWFPEAWNELAPSIPAEPGFMHAFAGLVQLADWLGSDTDHFTYSKGGDRWAFAHETAAAAIDGIGLDTIAMRSGLLRLPVFADLFPECTPRPMQEAVGSLPLPDTSGSVTLIEDETGAGKTEAALLHFARLFQAGLVDGLYFALPTRTAAVQLHRRVSAMIARYVPSMAVVLAVPGYLRVGDLEGRRLPAFTVQWSDQQRDPARWAAEHPKRYLAAACAVGTIDQVLLSALTVDHSHLRATCLLRHLLVVDEVHASDEYMSGLLRAVLKRHRTAGGHALLLSATLGSAAAASLMEWPVRPTLAQASEMAYPLLSSTGQQKRTEVAALGMKPPVAIDRLASAIDDPPRIARLALEAARQGARVLVLRNTVSGCLAVQDALEQQSGGQHLWRAGVDATVATVHHARFAREDREHLDRSIELAFGRDAVREGGLVCCATQTVQQSLDLDADLLITDLCPMDILLQRIGRLHRHQRTDRPAGFTEPRCIVLLPDQQPADLLTPGGKPRVRHGLGTVYQDLAIIAATWTELDAHPRMRIPADNRSLVEATTHPDALGSWRVLDERWKKHANQQFGIGVQHRQQAKNNCSRWDLPFNHSDARFPRDLDQRITTRLGDGDLRVELPGSPIGPFGYQISTLTISAWLLRDVQTSDPPVITTAPGALQIAYPGRAFVYDRLGLRLKFDDAEDDYADA
jgi:CRISPR-associated endonuclease/helicase Cas3